MSKHALVSIASILLLLGLFSPVGAEIRAVDRPSTDAGNDFYVGNRVPLTASPFMKLPVGAIEPQGWVRKQWVGCDESHQLLSEQNHAGL